MGSSSRFSFGKIGRITDPIERLKKAAHAYTEFGLEHPNHYQLMFMTPHPAIDKSESQVEKGNPEEDAYAFLKAASPRSRTSSTP